MSFYYSYFYCRPFCLLVALLFPCFSFASSYGIMEHKLLPLQVSSLGPTRIAFNNQKITDVFFYPEEAVKVVLHQSGSVFIVPQESHKHVYITVMGEEGLTQDLRLRFVEKQPEPIFLILPKQSHSNSTK